MDKIVEIQRKSNVLKRPGLPCLRHHYTINLASGCPLGCRYCYAQGFRNHPGNDKVCYYANTLDRLRRELARKRKKPELVYFSTACEPFIPHKPLLASLFGCMKLLLEESSSLIISTKALIPTEFLELFAAYPRRAQVQVGLNTVDDDVRGLIEPHAAQVHERLYNIEQLSHFGIQTVVRMDPVIPELTDSEESFATICSAIAERGVREIIASYLFLRAPRGWCSDRELAKWFYAQTACRLFTHRIEGFCSGGTARVTSPEYRSEKLELLEDTAGAHGISVRLCKCKNPDLTAKCCMRPTHHAADVSET